MARSPDVVRPGLSRLATSEGNSEETSREYSGRKATNPNVQGSYGGREATNPNVHRSQETARYKAPVRGNTFFADQDSRDRKPSKNISDPKASRAPATRSRPPEPPKSETRRFYKQVNDAWVQVGVPAIIALKYAADIEGAFNAPHTLPESERKSRKLPHGKAKVDVPLQRTASRRSDERRSERPSERREELSRVRESRRDPIYTENEERPLARREESSRVRESSRVPIDKDRSRRRQVRFELPDDGRENLRYRKVESSQVYSRRPVRNDGDERVRGSESSRAHQKRPDQKSANSFREVVYVTERTPRNGRNGRR